MNISKVVLILKRIFIATNWIIPMQRKSYKSVNIIQEQIWYTIDSQNEPCCCGKWIVSNVISNIVFHINSNHIQSDLVKCRNSIIVNTAFINRHGYYNVNYVCTYVIRKRKHFFSFNFELINQRDEKRWNEKRRWMGKA